MEEVGGQTPFQLLSSEVLNYWCYPGPWQLFGGILEFLRVGREGSEFIQLSTPEGDF